jgi:hypothetical protein
VVEEMGLDRARMSLPAFVAFGGYLVASRINRSAVVGELPVGIQVGPSGHGLMTCADFVAALAHPGAIYLLFTTGFGFCLKELTDPRHIGIAIVGVGARGRPDRPASGRPGSVSDGNENLASAFAVLIAAVHAADLGRR